MGHWIWGPHPGLSIRKSKLNLSKADQVVTWCQEIWHMDQKKLFLDNELGITNFYMEA